MGKGNDPNCAQSAAMPDPSAPPPLSTLTPSQIDEQIAELQNKISVVDRRIDREVRLRDSDKAWDRSRYEPGAHQQAVEERQALQAQVEQYDQEFDTRGGWPRYYHVTNNNGHVHTSVNCTSCYDDTLFAWRTDLSGLSEKEVVAREAHQACTVCMPIAPAEQKAARERYTEQQREARKAERDAKNTEKLRRSAERAQKLIVKIEKVVTDIGGWEVFYRDYSEYGHDGRKSTYDLTADLPTTVGDVLLDIQREATGQPRYHKDPYKVVEQARAAGVLDD